MGCFQTRILNRVNWTWLIQNDMEENNLIFFVIKPITFLVRTHWFLKHDIHSVEKSGWMDNCKEKWEGSLGCFLYEYKWRWGWIYILENNYYSKQCCRWRKYEENFLFVAQNSMLLKILMLKTKFYAGKIISCWRLDRYKSMWLQLRVLNGRYANINTQRELETVIKGISLFIPGVSIAWDGAQMGGFLLLPQTTQMKNYLIWGWREWF